MKKVLFLIFGMALTSGCQEQDLNEKATIGVSDCRKLNDSSMSAFIQENYTKALELINSAVECDQHNNLFIRNKAIILATGGMYQECINYLEKHSNRFTSVERLGTMAECYFHLHDLNKFDSLKVEVLSHAEREFNRASDQSNLITYITMLKKFDGEKRMTEVLNSNRDLFATPDMHADMLETMKKVPTLIMER